MIKWMLIFTRRVGEKLRVELNGKRVEIMVWALNGREGTTRLAFESDGIEITPGDSIDEESSNDTKKQE